MSEVTKQPDGVERRSQAPFAGPNGSALHGYIPEIWSVEKDVIYAAILAVESGLEYARECLTAHDSALGRTTHKNKMWAETMEKDIRHMERTLAMLRACGLND